MPGATLSDNLIHQAASGRLEARDQILRVMWPPVILMVAARLSAAPNRWCALDEIAQEVMVGLLESLPSLEERSELGLKCFAAGIVAHKVADYLRSDGVVFRRRRGAAMHSLDAAAGGTDAYSQWQRWLQDSRPTPQSAAHRAEALRKLMFELQQLKPEYREVITMAFFDQLPTLRIAAQLGVSRSAASMLVYRAVRALRRRLTGSSQVENGDDAYGR